MIHMPHRSVTRFFIPLIDVLLLLFCIFLLMPIARERELESQQDSAGDLADRLELLERELERKTLELQRFEDLRLVQAELEKIKEEIDRLRKEARKPVAQKISVYVLGIGPKGELSYYDWKDQKPVPVTDEKSAHDLIAKHEQEAKGRELYYVFLYPRPETGFPTLAQERQYKAWFEAVGHSLRPQMKEAAP